MKFKPGDIVKALRDSERYLHLMVTPAGSLGLITGAFVDSWSGRQKYWIDFDHVRVNMIESNLVAATPAEALAFRERGSFALNGHVEKRAYTLENTYCDYGHMSNPSEHYGERENPHVRLARMMGQPTWGNVHDALNAGRPSPDKRDWSKSNREVMVAYLRQRASKAREGA